MFTLGVRPYASGCAPKDQKLEVETRKAPENSCLFNVYFGCIYLILVCGLLDGQMVVVVYQVITKLEPPNVRTVPTISPIKYNIIHAKEENGQCCLSN